MKQVQYLIALVAGLVVFAHPAQGQVSQQRLSFSVFGQYQTNNTTTNAAVTNSYQMIKSLLLSTANVVKAIAIDLDGTKWTNWNGAVLVRRTGLTIDGTNSGEGIYLVKGAVSTNVSHFFGTSYLNDFAGDVINNFAASLAVGTTNDPVLASIHTTTHARDFTYTNTFRSSGLFSVSLDTVNLAFNLVGYGNTIGTNLVGHLSHNTNLFGGEVDTLEVSGVGTFRVNLETNLFNTPTNFVSGPAHGSFGMSPPVFTTFTNSLPSP